MVSLKVSIKIRRILGYSWLKLKYFQQQSIMNQKACSNVENQSSLKHGIGTDIFKQIPLFCFQLNLSHRVILLQLINAKNEIFDTPVYGCNSCLKWKKLLSLGINPRLDPRHVFERQHTVFNPTATATWPNISEDITDDLYLVCPFQLMDSILTIWIYKMTQTVLIHSVFVKSF